MRPYHLTSPHNECTRAQGWAVLSGCGQHETGLSHATCIPLLTTATSCGTAFNASASASQGAAHPRARGTLLADWITKAVAETPVVAAACPVHDDVRVVGEWDTPSGFPGVFLFRSVTARPYHLFMRSSGAGFCRSVSGDGTTLTRRRCTPSKGMFLPPRLRSPMGRTPRGYALICLARRAS